MVDSKALRAVLAGWGMTAAVWAVAATGASAVTAPPEPPDPYQWLEAVEGKEALEWVKSRSDATLQSLQRDARFGGLQTQLREVLDARDRIAQVGRRGQWLYNFWQDARNPRGLWRRTTMAEYRKPQPAWEVLLDLDALGKAEGQSWVWKGSSCLPARAGQAQRCLLSLSPGGSDATTLREFDLETRSFVADGFRLPLSKSGWTWVDADTLLVGTDTGPGSMTDSGYPRTLRLWKRGTPLQQAPVVFEGATTDVSVSASSDLRGEFPRVTITRAIDFYRTEDHLWENGRAVRLHKPAADTRIGVWRDQALLRLRSAWQQGDRSWPAGSLLMLPLSALRSPDARVEPQVLFTPTAQRSLSAYAVAAGALVLQVMQDVTDRLEVLRPPVQGQREWSRTTLDLPTTGSLTLQALHDPAVSEDEWGEHLLVQYNDLLTPETQWLLRTDRPGREVLQARAPRFDAQGLVLEQRFATSRDGTRVPYFLVRHRDAARGPRPTLLYGYGGFDISMRSAYSAGIGRAWLERGGVYALANIRGGGEYGPTWHRAAIGANKQRSYDDFIAIAEDLIRSGITTAPQLGMRGGSNGGLLVGAVMVQRPDLFGAVVCQVPLLDMRRYHRLLAGASWMAEYGNPDIAEEWAWISRYSPYHNIPPSQGEGARRLPPMLLVTSTKDDRVHPGHARKMAARLESLGHPVQYWENMEGGHGGAADNEQRALMQAIEYTFLWQRLGGSTGAERQP